MIEYIYFVKCPTCDNCEDEPFYTFDDAVACALGRLSKKPIITQVEVDRNDFGECTDSHDVGTIWSWEKLMNDIPAEPDFAVFTKDDFCTEYNPETDPEFLVLDNDIDTDFISAEKPTEPTEEPVALKTFKTPIPEGMTIKELVEAMEENEDTVECALCNELFPKEECHHHTNEGWVCSDCLENTIECSWCGFLYDSSDCRYEVDLGWLCDRCEGGIKSRGEPLTFRENNYASSIDEDIDSPETEEDSVEYPSPQELVKEAIEQLILKPNYKFNSVTIDDICRYRIIPYIAEKLNLKQSTNSARNDYAAKAGWPDDKGPFSRWFGNLFEEARKQLMEIYKAKLSANYDEVAEDFYRQRIEIEYEDVEVNYSKQLDVDVFDEWTEYENYTYSIDAGSAVEYIIDHLTQEDLDDMDFEGSVEDFLNIKSSEEQDIYIIPNFDILYSNHEEAIIEYFREDAEEAANNPW